MTVKIIGLIVIVITLSVSIVSFNLRDRYCENLNRISKNDALVSKLRQGIDSLLEEPHDLISSGREGGLIFIRNSESDFGIDWKLLEIPIEDATLGMYGKELRYQSFDKNKVEVVRIGYGYRKHLAFKIKVENATSLEKGYTLEVECRP